jgi:hypothetical protein
LCLNAYTLLRNTYADRMRFYRDTSKLSTPTTTFRASISTNSTARL